MIESKGALTSKINWLGILILLTTVLQDPVFADLFGSLFPAGMIDRLGYALGILVLYFRSNGEVNLPVDWKQPLKKALLALLFLPFLTAYANAGPVIGGGAGGGSGGGADNATIESLIQQSHADNNATNSETRSDQSVTPASLAYWSQNALTTRLMAWLADGTITSIVVGDGNFTVDASGNVTAKSYSTTRGDAAQYIELYEATSDGDSKATIAVPAKGTGLAGDVSITVSQSLAFTGTMTDGKYCTYASSGNVIACNSTPAGTGDFLADGSVPMTGALVPNAADTLAIGSATAEWANLFLGDGAIIYGQNDQSNTLTSSATAWTVALDLSVQGGDVTIADDGVKLTGSNGSLTILGLGDGQDEDVKIDLNTTANTIEITSPASSATTVDFNTLNLVSTGYIQGKIKINSDADGEDNATMAAAGMYGTLFIATGAGTWTLPTAVEGMSLCLMNTGAAADLILDVQPTDTMSLKGTEDSAGDGITNATGSTTGDFVCVVATAANKWATMGMQGTWTAQ